MAFCLSYFCYMAHISNTAMSSQEEKQVFEWMSAMFIMWPTVKLQLLYDGRGWRLGSLNAFFVVSAT